MLFKYTGSCKKEDAHIMHEQYRIAFLNTYAGDFKGKNVHMENKIFPNKFLIKDLPSHP